MNCIHVTKSDPVELQVDGDFFVFLVLTVLLLILTMGAWLVFECRGRRKSAEKENEKGVDWA